MPKLNLEIPVYHLLLQTMRKPKMSYNQSKSIKSDSIFIAHSPLCPLHFIDWSCKYFVRLNRNSLTYIIYYWWKFLVSTCTPVCESFSFINISDMILKCFKHCHNRFVPFSIMFTNCMERIINHRLLEFIEQTHCEALPKLQTI